MKIASRGRTLLRCGDLVEKLDVAGMLRPGTIGLAKLQHKEVHTIRAGLTIAEVRSIPTIADHVAFEHQVAPSPIDPGIGANKAPRREPCIVRGIPVQVA